MKFFYNLSYLSKFPQILQTWLRVYKIFPYWQKLFPKYHVIQNSSLFILYHTYKYLCIKKLDICLKITQKLTGKGFGSRKYLGKSFCTSGEIIYPITGHPKTPRGRTDRREDRNIDVKVRITRKLFQWDLVK